MQAQSNDAYIYAISGSRSARMQNDELHQAALYNWRLDSNKKKWSELIKPNGKGQPLLQET